MKSENVIFLLLFFTFDPMLILISSAKTMASRIKKVEIPGTCPLFQAEANELAMYMAQFTAEELGHVLKINPKLAAENYARYRSFHGNEEERLPAVFAYTGIVFKYLKPAQLTVDDLMYAQDHLRLGSGIYGLLRPLDLIKPYRMEYGVKLPELEGDTVYPYWRERLTDQLIADVQKAGGVLIHLAAGDVIPSFDWKRVQQSVRVITPDFKMWKGDVLKSIVIYLKMARGTLSRYIIQNRIDDPEGLKAFEWEGFRYSEEHSTDDHWVFTP